MIKFLKAYTFFLNFKWKLLSFLIFFLTSYCASDPVRVNDGVFEEQLSEISGVSSEEYNYAKSKEELNLFDIYAIAIESNERIAIRYEKVRQAEARKRASYGMFLPTLSYRNQKSQFFPDPKETQRENQKKEILYNASGLPPQYLPLYTSGSGSGGFSLPPSIRSGQRLVLHVPIFTGLNEYSNIQASRDEVKLKKYEMSMESRQLLIDLSHNYYSLLLLNKTLEQRKESLKITKSLEKEYKRRVNLGLARSFELAGFSSRVAIIEAEIYSLEQQIIAGEERIRFLSGINSVQTIKDDISIGTPGYDEKEAMDSLNNRVDIKAAKASLNYSKEKELGAKGEFLPNVYVDGIYNIPQGNTSESYFFQFILEVPIFSGGKTISSIQEYESLRREAELNLNITLKNGLEEIRNLYRTFEISIKERESYKKALEAADKSHKLTLRDYNRKLAASPDILNSLSNLALVKENYERSEIQVRLNRILLGIAVGEFPKNANHWKEKN